MDTVAFGLFCVIILPVAAVLYGMLRGTQMPAFPDPAEDAKEIQLRITQ